MLAHAQCITHESHKCLKWERFIIIYYSMMELHSKKVNNWNGTMYDILYELWSTKYAMNKFEMELIWADLMCMPLLLSKEISSFNFISRYFSRFLCHGSVLRSKFNLFVVHWMACTRNMWNEHFTVAGCLICFCSQQKRHRFMCNERLMNRNNIWFESIKKAIAFHILTFNMWSFYYSLIIEFIKYKNRRFKFQM